MSLSSQCPRASSEIPIKNNMNFVTQVVAEITLAVGGVQIEEPQVDYLAFKTREEPLSFSPNLN